MKNSSKLHFCVNTYKKCEFSHYFVKYFPVFLVKGFTNKIQLKVVQYPLIKIHPNNSHRETFLFKTSWRSEFLIFFYETRTGRFGINCNMFCKWQTKIIFYNKCMLQEIFFCTFFLIIFHFDHFVYSTLKFLACQEKLS